MRAKTKFRAVRLPTAIDRSVSAAAKNSSTTFSAVIVAVLAEAIASGRLPKPKTETDRAQLAFL